MGARQRSGEGVVRRNGRPKGCFWRVCFFFAPLRFSGHFKCFKSKPQGGREETESPKTPFWTTVSPHDTFAAPLARSENRGQISKIFREVFAAFFAEDFEVSRRLLPGFSPNLALTGEQSVLYNNFRGYQARVVVVVQMFVSSQASTLKKHKTVERCSVALSC